MAHIQRLYDFQAGTKIISGQVDAEFNQLISYVNGLDDTNGVLAGATGATKVGVGEGGNLQTLLDQLVRFATANIKHIRLNVDKVIETSPDGVNWEASGSSGHLIQRANGEILTQRSRLQFLNTTITDDTANNRTVIQGLIGPTGPQGIQGPQGNQGIQGPTGKSIIPDVNQTTGLMSFSEGEPGVIPSPVNVRGPQGIAGVAGPQGPAGAPGPVGVQGAPGPAGIQGVPGIQGLKGDKGATGPEGPQGARGLKGDTGNTGAQGPAGAQGIQGAVGAQGPQGPQGLKGDDGADGTSFAILGVYSTLLALQTAHPVGNAGDAWFIGSTAPYSVYNWDTNVSQWVNVGQLEGPQGPQGIQGIQGAQGIQGETGAQGAQGAQGPQGIQGELGPGYYPQGAWVEEADYVRDDTQIDVVDYEGSSYFCKLSHESDDGNKPPHSTYWGLLAEKGDQGVQGIQGAQGIQGIQGPQGIQGAQGNPGPGLPVGGTTGQIITKVDATDYNTQWKPVADVALPATGGTITGDLIIGCEFDPLIRLVNDDGDTNTEIITSYDGLGASVLGIGIATKAGSPLPNVFTKLQLKLEEQDVKEVFKLIRRESGVTSNYRLYGEHNPPNFAFSGTLANTSWTGSSAPYTKAVTATGILAAGKTPTVDVVLSATWATALTEEAEWAKIKRIAYTNNTLTFYATAVPSVALNFTGVQPK